MCEEVPKFDFAAEREKYSSLPEFQELESQTPDAIEMIAGASAGDGLTGQESIDFWNDIGQGQGGFYDHIREYGCSSCGSHTPGCCDGCA